MQSISIPPAPNHTGFQSDAYRRNILQNESTESEDDQTTICSPAIITRRIPTLITLKKRTVLLFSLGIISLTLVATNTSYYSSTLRPKLRPAEYDQPISMHRKRGDRIVVTLTTTPSRIAHIKPTIESILTQTLRPDTVYVVLSRGISHPRRGAYDKHGSMIYDTPSFLKTYEQMGLITVLQPKLYFGPMDKLVHALLSENHAPDTKVIYVEDQYVYDSDMVRNLYLKSIEYPNCAVSFRGAVLRSHFRQVGKGNGDLDRHPYLYFKMSGEEKEGWPDSKVDIVDGMAGVLVQPNFFDFVALMDLISDDSIPIDVLKSDCLIISSHLEKRNITRWLVRGLKQRPVIQQAVSGVGAVPGLIHKNTVDAAYYLQQRLNIWRQFNFLNSNSLSKDLLDMFYCEAGDVAFCSTPQLAVNGGKEKEKITLMLDEALGVGSSM